MLDKIKKFKLFIGPETWKYLVLSILIGFALFAIESSFVLVIQVFLLSIGLLNKNQVFLPEWVPTNLTAGVVTLIVFGAFRAYIFTLKNYFAVRTQAEFIYNHRLGLLQYSLNNAGIVSSKKLITSFTELISQGGTAIYYCAISVNTLITAVLFLFLGFRLAPQEMVLSVVLLGLFVYPIKQSSRKISAHGQGVIREWEAVSDGLIKGLKNYFFLSIYHQVDVEVKRGEESLNKYRTHYIAYSKIAGLMGAIPLFIGVSIVSFISFVSVRYIHTDSIKLVSFIYIFIRLAQSASEASTNYSNVKLNLPGLEILYDWKLKLKSSESHPKLPIKVISSGPIDVEFKNVSLKYENQNYLFNELSFKLSKGDVFILKGESGTGKSSLLSLILAVNKPSRGEVLINNFSTSLYKLDLQNVLAYVGPEPFLISGSVRENLHYGLHDLVLKDTDIWDVFKKTKIYDLVQSLPNKLDELIYDIPQFSTGQKQRLSFARALLRNPQILVLDEATANLDMETETVLIDNIRETLKDCTTIIVTHKNSFDNLGTKFLNL